MNGLYIVSHFAPYRDQTIADINNAGEHSIHIYSIDLKANTHPEWEYVNQSSCIHFFEKHIQIPILGTWNSDIKKILQKHKDSDFYILSGYRPATLCYAVFKAILARKPFIYSTDKKEFGTVLGDKIARYISSKASAVWVPGEASRNYLQSIGIDGNKIFAGCYINSRKELIRRITANSHRRNLLREQLGFEESDTVFLFVGKLIPRRNIENLLNAFRKISETRHIKLLIIGDGPQLYLLEAFNSPNIVNIKQCPFNDLYQYYMCADAYVHPGNEPYSLAAVDASVAGLPVVATEGVGASADTIKNGKNGFIIPENDSDALANAMLKIYEKNFDEDAVKSMQQFLIKERDIDWAARELSKAINKCCKK